MRYSFRFAPGKPPPQDQEVVVGLPGVPARAGAPVSSGVPSVDVAIAAALATVNAPIGTATNVVFTASNPGDADASGSTLKLPWLTSNADRTIGAASVSTTGGAATATVSNAALIAGLAISAFPPASTVQVTVPVTALLPFAEAAIASVSPQSGAGDMVPANNVAVSLIKGQAATSGAEWIQWGSSTTATAITLSARESAFSPDIIFCGDDYVQVLIGGDWVSESCPSFSNAAGARCKIKLTGYNASSTYTVEINQSALSPAPNGTAFTATQTADEIEISTAYALLGVDIGDGLISAGLATFTVKENGTTIAVLDLTVQQFT